ncbi:MAG TPA: type I 3-dehydroquinate dehydratase [Thermoplasmata archaeon]|nr:type I 3-dehydroquinate dehydratase [Thermoplasmata archaeon]
MTGRMPLIVVTLPARSAEDARSQIAAARAGGADVAEVRLDRWAVSDLPHLGRLFPSALPLLATYRSRAEGGLGTAETPERARLLLQFGSLPFRWIDLEYDRDLPLLPSLPPPEKLGRILSVHLGTAPPAEWARRIGLLTDAASGVGKLVVSASVLETFRELIPRLPSPEEAALVVHTVGPSGPLLRVLSRRLGFPMVYACLPEGTGPVPVEPSQIPVDRLRPFLAAEGLPPLFAVAGRPIGHSQSPSLHTRWMRAEGRVGIYLPLEFGSDDEFVQSLPHLASSGFRGLNVTHPFKSVAFEAATISGKGADACRATNCLTFRDGAIEGENTDLVAILRRLGELRETGRWDGRSLGVVGAGGSARATLAAARTLSAEAVVYARRVESARALAEEFSATLGSADAPRPLPLVVQATNVGREGSGALEVPLGRLLEKGSHVVDWVYDASDPAVRRTAEAAGATYEDGWRLLVYQAAASYALWWGNDPEPAAFADALAEGGCTV